MYKPSDIGSRPPSHALYERKVSCCDKQPIYIALIILGVVGIGVVGGIGVAGFGASQSWWSISAAISHLGKLKAIVMIAAGGGGGSLLLIAGALGSVRSYYKAKEREYLNKNARSRDLASESEGSFSEEEILEIEKEYHQLIDDGILVRQESDDRIHEGASSDDEEWVIVDDLSSIEEPLSRVEQAWRVFSYEQVAEQKYQAVLDEYVRNLGLAELTELHSEVEESLYDDPHNQLLKHLQKVLFYLIHPEVHGSRLSYQNMVKELRAAINSPGYKGISAERPRAFIRKLCLVRWKGTHIHNYLKDIVLLTIGKDSVPMDFDSFPETVLEVNREMKNSSRNKKSTVALEGQKLSGALGLEDFCGTKNTPNVRCIQHFRNEKGDVLPITYVRHGTPTALGDEYYSMGIAARTIIAPFGRFFGYEMESGEEVTVDYKEYLLALEEKGESELFCIYQRRTPDVVENERTRVLKIEGLQESHQNIFVLTQPVEGDLFEHRGEYANVGTFEELKKALEVEFFDRVPDDPSTRASLPLYLRGDEVYRSDYRQILRDVHEIFFPDEEEAVDSSLHASVLEIDAQLEKAYSEKANEIKDLVLGRDLKRVEGTSVEEGVLEKLLNDEKFIESLKRQFTNLDQLGEWVEVDRKKSLEEHLKNLEILKELIEKVAGSAAELILKSDSTAKLEQEKAKFLSKWQSYILLVYAFQKMELKFRLNGVGGFKLSAFKSPCKDFLDRGGNQGFIEDRLMHYMIGVESDPVKMEEALFNLLGPPILVKKKEAIERRIIPGMNVERVLAMMKPESKRRLAQYTFGEAKWKPVGVETPKIKGQSGIPSVLRQIKLEIERTFPASIEEIEADKEYWTEKLVVILQRYVGIELGQPFDVMVGERDYIRENRFDLEKIRYQVMRDMTGVKLEVSGQEVTSFDYLVETLLAHPLIGGDEQKALKILASFHQSLGAEMIMPFQSALGKTFGNLVFVSNKKPKNDREIVRYFQLDLSQKDSISIHYRDSYLLREETTYLFELKVAAEIQYSSLHEDELTAEGHSSLSIKEVHPVKAYF